MSKKLIFIFSCIGIPAFAYYTALHASWFDTVTMSEYMLPYFDNANYYFLLYTILTLPFLFLFDTPVLEPIFYIRLKGNMLYHILKKGVAMSALLSVYIFFSFMISGLIFKYENDMQPSWIKYLCVLFLFILSVYINSFVAYFLTNKQTLGRLSIFLNYLIVVFVCAIDLLDFMTISVKDALNIIMEVYIALSLTLGIFYLYRQSKAKECLKLKNT